MGVFNQKFEALFPCTGALGCLDVNWSTSCCLAGQLQLCLLHSLLAFSHFPRYPRAKWDLLVLIPMWVGLYTFWDPVGLSNKLCCEAGHLSLCCLNPHRYFQSEV